MRRSHTRRDFMKLTAGTIILLPNAGARAAGNFLKDAVILNPQDQATTQAQAAPETQPAYPQLRIAYIATGGIGGHHLEHTQSLGVHCPCYCDVDTTRMKSFAQAFPQAKIYQDYREMFDREAKNFDAVMIGTPDHHHYPATIIAMQLGKHVYTQKPLTHTPWEARQLAEAAKKYKVVTQMGNQGHAGEGWRLVYEFIRSGALGDIRETHTWTDRPIWPQGEGRPEGEDPVPETLNWDCWLGPAPERPFKTKAYHAFVWRGWWDFGAGALGDMACHTMDGIFWALEPGHPSSIEVVSSTLVNDEMFPKAAIIKWSFPAKGPRPAFVSYWYDGGLMPGTPAELEMGRRLSETGNLLVGTKASMLVTGDYGESPRIFPEEKAKAAGRPPKLLERSPGHILEWVQACVGEQPADFARSNFTYSAPFTETILLGNVALRLGRKLEWNGQKQEFTNCPEANQFLTKEYRTGWKF